MFLKLHACEIWYCPKDDAPPDHPFNCVVLTEKNTWCIFRNFFCCLFVYPCTWLAFNNWSTAHNKLAHLPDVFLFFVLVFYLSILVYFNIKVKKKKYLGWYTFMEQFLNWVVHFYSLDLSSVFFKYIYMIYFVDPMRKKWFLCIF